MQRETAVNRARTPTSWNDIDWCRNRKLVRNLRRRIYRASRQGDHRKLRSLQRLMLKSRANRELSIRQVTQINKGRLTAGVDKLVVKTPEARKGWQRKYVSTSRGRLNRQDGCTSQRQTARGGRSAFQRCLTAVCRPS